MMDKRFFLLMFCFILTVFLVIPVTVRAESSQFQVYYQTPTPGSDGRIMYTVKSGDSCMRISLLHGIPEDELRRLNNLKGDCVIIPGQQLLISIVSVTAVPVASPTPTKISALSTEGAGTGQICILLYNDINGNAMPDTNETQIRGGAISITDPLGKISKTANTTDSIERVCFLDLPEGEYNISVAVPEGYNPTTTMNFPIKIKAGDQTLLNFGAQVSSKAQQQPTAVVPGATGPTETVVDNRSPLLAIVGGVLILSGLGLGFYFRRMRRQ